VGADNVPRSAVFARRGVPRRLGAAPLPVLAGPSHCALTLHVWRRTPARAGATNSRVRQILAVQSSSTSSVLGPRSSNVSVTYPDGTASPPHTGGNQPRQPTAPFRPFWNAMSSLNWPGVQAGFTNLLPPVIARRAAASDACRPPPPHATPVKSPLNPLSLSTWDPGCPGPNFGPMHTPSREAAVSHRRHERWCRFRTGGSSGPLELGLNVFCRACGNRRPLTTGFGPGFP